MKQVFVDERWLGSHGIGRFAREVADRLQLLPAGLPLKPTHPLDTFVVSAWLARNREAFLFVPGYNAPLSGLERCAIVVHDLNHLDVSHNSGRLKRLYYERILRPACSKAAAVMTVSEFTARRLSEWSGVAESRISVVGNGVSAAFRADVTPHDLGARYFFVVGNRKGHKNEARIVEAFGMLQGLNDVQLVFNGEGTDELRQAAQRVGVSARLHFVGRLTEEMLASYYAGALALIFPSLYEGFGLPVVESMACGTPVLTSTTTSLPEIAGDAALLVDPESVSEIAAGMQDLADDQPLRERLRAKGFARASRFSWDEVAKRVDHALARAMDA